MKQYVELPIKQIKPDPNQPRQLIGDDGLQELAGNIAQHGVLQPIEVSKNGDGRYMIHHGERRWRAAQLAGLKTIPAIVAQHQSGDERLVKQLVENLQREDMAPIDEAKAYQRLIESGVSQREIGKLVGRSYATVAARVMWLKLEPEIQILVNERLLPTDKRVVMAFLDIPDSGVRVKLASRMARPGLPIKALVTAANKVADRLRQDDTVNRSAPSLRLNRRYHRENDVVPKGEIRSAAKTMCEECFNYPNTLLNEPAWTLIVHHAENMCRKCDAWEPGDNLLICNECPGVQLIGSLIKAVERDD